MRSLALFLGLAAVAGFAFASSRGAVLAAGATVSFTLTNSTIGAEDVIAVHRKSGGTAGAYIVRCDSSAAGSCVIAVKNDTAGALGEAVVLQFRVLNGETT